MAIRGVALWVQYVCLDSSNVPLTGDLASHTIKWAADDGTVTTCTNNQGGPGKHEEVASGVYRILLTATETDCVSGVLLGTSTAGSVIVPKSETFIAGNSAGEVAATIDFDSLLAVEVDGVALSKLLQLLLASSINKTDREGRRITMYARDGTTVVATLTFNPYNPGQITSSVIN
jgi:hypothetical protein